MQIVHPFMNLDTVSELSIDELQVKIGELNKKLTTAYRMQNPQLVNQVRMVIEGYNQEYYKKINEQYKKLNLDKKIDISSDSAPDSDLGNGLY